MLMKYSGKSKIGCFVFDIAYVRSASMPKAQKDSDSRRRSMPAMRPWSFPEAIDLLKRRCMDFCITCRPKATCWSANPLLPMKLSKNARTMQEISVDLTSSSSSRARIEWRSPWIAFWYCPSAKSRWGQCGGANR